MVKDKYTLLSELLPLLARYEEERNGTATSVTDFGAWLTAGMPEPEAELSSQLAPLPYVEGSIAQYLTGMYRYAKFYVKKAFKHTQLDSLDDFGYLICLLEEGSMSKVALITKNIQEVPSGTEVIKRLLRKGWIDEKEDEQDRRSVKVYLNEKGKAALLGSFEQIARISSIVSGNLSQREKLELLRLLKKLDQFHYHIFTSQRTEELDVILQSSGLQP